MSPEDLRYTEKHAWMRQEGAEWLVGVTDYAAGSMGDVIFVELPAVGTGVAPGQTYGSVESAKAVEDLVSPLSGEVVRVNEALEDTPETLNEDAYGAGWIIAVKPTGEVDLSGTLSAAQYEAYLQAQA